MYPIFGTIKRTVRPVWRGMTVGLVDVQGLPPRGWCEDCGAEVWQAGERLCSRCRQNGQWTIDN